MSEYPDKLAEYIDKLDFNNMDFAEEMKCIWDLAQEQIISEFEKCVDWIEKEYNEQGKISISHYLERVREKLRR